MLTTSPPNDLIPAVAIGLLAVIGLLGLAGLLTVLWRSALRRARLTETENLRLRRFAAAASLPADVRPEPPAPREPPADITAVAELLALEPRVSLATSPPGIDLDRPERRAMANNLRNAVANDELSLHYQAVCNAETLSVMSYDALLRWKSPLGSGFVPPGEFIPIAEATGIMVSIGHWALQTACVEAASWPERHGVSLNLSLVQLQDAQFAGCVADVLARTGLPAGRLELEVSEHLMGNPGERVLESMRSLQAQGIRIALDDFGSTNGSLTALRWFSFDRVKIHRSFVVGLGITPSADATMLAILDMARGCGLDVTATGVETEPQLAILRAMRCNHLQGFLLGRPAPGAATTEPGVAALAAV